MMALHLIKLAVGIRDVEHLAEVQRGRQYERDGRLVVPGWTRRMPTRTAEILEGGSIYWVIKGAVRCRQRVLDFETVPEEEGKTWCRLILDPDLVQTAGQPKKAFQGWRYLRPEDAPRDLSAGDGDDLPPHLLAELRELGLV